MIIHFIAINLNMIGILNREILWRSSFQRFFWNYLDKILLAKNIIIHLISEKIKYHWMSPRKISSEDLLFRDFFWFPLAKIFDEES